MIPEIGHFSLIIAFAFSIILSVVPFYGSTKNKLDYMVLSKNLALGQCFFVTLSFFILAKSFVFDDFSLLYVANNSNSSLPTIYKFCATWGAHEGSLLLWILILSWWMTFVAISKKKVPIKILSRVLSILGLISFGFLMFILFTSNPFIRLNPSPFDGLDLNPLLQDIGLVSHPPMLYFGYVGFAVCFAFSIAYLLEGKVDKGFASFVKPWTIAAWSFLTIGITLGSWWAYYELGWGGWWFWDPVENASFMPWLVGAALIHSIIVTKKRDGFYAWCFILSILAFSLSLLGTFIVRSGVITSVHAFASDPTRGLYMLIYLGVVIGGSLTIYSLKVKKIYNEISLKFLSKETFMLINTLLLVVACGSILIGTLYPLFYDLVYSEQISVGYPFFNAVFIPIMIILLIFMAVVTELSWESTKLKSLKNELFTLVVSTLLTVIITSIFVGVKLKMLFGLGLCYAVLIGLVINQVKKIKKLNLKFIDAIKSSISPMNISHFGFIITAIGIIISSNMSIEKDIALKPGDSVELGTYVVNFTDIFKREGSNYLSDIGKFSVKNGNKLTTTLFPEKRFYIVQETYISETAIYPGLFKDIYIALGEKLANNYWSVRIYYKPFVRWIWIGGLIMAMGGLISIARRNYKLHK